MAVATDSLLSIRAELHRKALADARQRAGLAKRLGFTDSDVLAVQHLARAGRSDARPARRCCSSRRAAPPR